MPLEPGTQPFYQWVTTRVGYYPISRWEWFAVIEEINKQAKLNPVSILEIGCGGGNFISLVQNIQNVRIVGIDTTPESVTQCQEKGFEVYCETIDSFTKKFSELKFDYVVSFHCLEHISDPKNFVESMLFLLKPTGSLLISTPYSPMSFEQGWFDIMNHPPHHMTRWNQKAYNELAWQLKCKIEYFMPSTRSTLQRTTNTFRLINFGRNKSVIKSRLIPVLMAKFPLFIILLARQLFRPKLNGITSADTVLVKLVR
ncbi:class I SAM-dependent methyltransferase [Merismopedia glauca]|uniref:class I SAM-dependent methyltransferase n=1 Tax=Merismopedia glauca TaxID=292586 RepID=UPI0015E79CEE|nr:class I SAM-dependent methyltransferase [Merismopedia glauca]